VRGEIEWKGEKMAKFTLELSLDNDAFVGDSLYIELSRILRGSANTITGGNLEFTLKDINGNTVGQTKLLKGNRRPLHHSQF